MMPFLVRAGCIISYTICMHAFSHFHKDLTKASILPLKTTNFVLSCPQASPMKQKQLNISTLGWCEVQEWINSKSPSDFLEGNRYQMQPNWSSWDRLTPWIEALQATGPCTSQTFDALIARFIENAGEKRSMSLCWLMRPEWMRRNQFILDPGWE